MTQGRRNPSRGKAGQRPPTVLERLHALHQQKQHYLGADLAPDVDRKLLQQLVRRQLSDQDARLVYELIHAFRAWDKAHTAIIAEEFRTRLR